MIIGCSGIYLLLRIGKRVVSDVNDLGYSERLINHEGVRV